jgi:AcrR family transcriptional regulator
MRQIAEACDQSTGNLYHHFGSKEAIFQRLIDDYWERLLDPEHDLQKVFTKADFPDDLEELAAAIERTVEENKASILPHFEELEREGRLADADPMVAVMVATRWLFYFYTVEKCFSVPMHFGMEAQQAVDGFIRILRNGVLRRDEVGAASEIRT